MKVKNWIIVALVGALTLSLVTIVTAQDSQTANVEVRVWQSTGDAESLYISARPEGGSWATLGTTPLDMSGLNSRGTFKYGDITVAVPLPRGEGAASESSSFTPVYGQGQHNDTYYYAEASGYAYAFVFDTTGSDTRVYRFYLTCEETEWRHVSLLAPERAYIPGQIGEFVRVTYQLDDGPLVQEQWRLLTYRQLNSTFVPDGLREAQQITIWLANTARTFDISGLHDTVIQGNIDNCHKFSELTE